MKRKLVPWVFEGLSPGAQILELGPGPGLTTELLQGVTPRLIAIEIDFALARRAADRLRGTDARVIQGDASALPFADSGFTSAVCIAMLHHLRTPALQDRMFREVRRVLRPGGMFVGADSLNSWAMRLLHVADTHTPIDPAALPARLEAAGFRCISIERGFRMFRFRAIAGKACQRAV
ncbi:MAG: class I SAM-dependent methyltransferase [Terriglobia bacterium]